MSRKNHSVSIVKMKGTWQENATDPNDAAYIERQTTDRTSILILDATDVMRWAM